MKFHLLLQYGLRDLMVSSFPIRILADSLASRIHASFVLLLSDTPLPQFFIILHGTARAPDVYNFLRAFLDGFFKIRILWVDEKDSFAIFVRFQDGTFH